MSQFFKALAVLLVDRQEFEMNAKKIGEDLVLTVMPDKKKGKVTHITIPDEDLNDEIDSKIFGALNAPIATDKATFQVNQSEVEESEENDEDEDKKPAKKESPKTKTTKEDKKSPAKKSQPAKGKKETTKAEDKQIEALQEEKAPEPVTKNEESVTETSTMSEQFVKDVEAAVSKGDYDLNTTQSPDKSASVKETVKDEEYVADSKEETSPAAQPETEKQEDLDPLEIYNSLMNKGKDAFQNRNYKEAESAYKEATELFPDDTKAKAALENASKWVRAVERMREG